MKLKNYKFYIVANTLVWPYKGNNMAGSMKNIFELIKVLDGYNIEHYFIGPQIAYSWLNYEGLRSNHLITSRIKNRPTFLFSWIWVTLMTLINPPKIKNNSILYSESEFLPNTIPIIRMKRKNKNIKWICCVRSLAPRQFYLKDFRFIKDCLYIFSQWLSAKIFIKYADLVFVVNSKIKNQMLSYGVPENKISIIDNGININLVNSISNNTEKMYDAVFIGRIMHHKGILDLIEIWSDVIKKIPQAKIAILGNGEDYYLDQIKSKISKYKLENHFLLLGFIGGKEKYKIIKKSKMLVLPSYLEGKPNAFNDAMSCRIPIITYQLDYYKEFYQELLNNVKVGDKEKFSKKIIELLSNNKERKKQGEQNYNFIKKYDWQVVINTNLNYINNIL